MASDIRAHAEVSTVYPVCPCVMILQSRTPKAVCSRTLIAESDGQLWQTDEDGVRSYQGDWWPHSASCLGIVTNEGHSFFQYDDNGRWLSRNNGSTITWSRKRIKTNNFSPQRTPSKNAYRSSSGQSPNMSRFRMSMLPLDRLDKLHRSQLACMGLRLCLHADVGRVLVSERRFEEGEIMIYSRVSTFDVETDEDVMDMISVTDPSCCYLLVPRTKKLYYNKGKFSHENPIESGDLWYLVNHSARPNVDVVLRNLGIQFKAKRVIHPNEPITWTYPHGFFSKDDTSIDLPQFILPDNPNTLPPT